MALELGGILAGVAVRTEGNGSQRLVQRTPPTVEKRTLDQLVRLRRGQRFPAGTADPGRRDGDGVGSADAQDADRDGAMGVARAAMVSDKTGRSFSASGGQMLDQDLDPDPDENNTAHQRRTLLE
jgi:hypothetical protein